MVYAADRQQKAIEQQREQVIQLRREASIQRITVSRALADLQRFVVEKQAEDYLLIGFANVKLNPYRERSSCTLF